MRVTKYKVSSGMHAINLDSAVHRLLSMNRLIDVTLACDGQKLRCHRLILAAASPLFEDLLVDNPTYHPTVIMPMGLKASTIKTLIDFMYTGEANVTKAGLSELAESAEILQVAGIFDTNTDIREYFVEVDDDQVEEEPEGIDKRFRTFQFKINHVSECATQTESLVSETPESQQSTSTSASAVNQPTVTNPIVTEPNVTKPSEKNPKEDAIQFIQIEDSEDFPSEILDAITANDKSFTLTNSEITINNDSKDSDTAAALIANDNETILQEATRIKLGQNKPSTSNILSTIPKVDVQESVKQINLLQLAAASRQPAKPPQMNLATTQAPSKPIPWTYIHIPTVKTKVRQNILKPTIKRPILPKSTTATPWTIYQPLPQLGPGQAYIASPIHLTPAAALKPAPITSFLKFNSSSMQISVKNLDRTDKQEKLKVVNMALEKETDNISKPQPSSGKVIDAAPPPPPPSPPPSPRPSPPPTQEPIEINLKSEQDDCEVTVGGTVVRQSDFPMFYAMIKKEQDDLGVQTNEQNDEELDVEAVAETESEPAATMKTANFTAGLSAAFDVAPIKAVNAKTATVTTMSEAEAEDIICQPSVSYIYDDYEDIKDDYECDDDEAGVCIDYDRLVAETYGIDVEEDEKKTKTKAKKQTKKRQYKSKKTTETTQSFLMPKSSPHPFQCLPNTVPLSVMSPTQASKHFYFPQKTDDESLNTTFANNISFGDEMNSHKRENESHSPQTVILRSPRCNQPRHYSTDNLYNALMAVKHGESIYRASRQHEVPRKTLRNWMKRWDIKSKFPMPKQLKDAARKKKQSLAPDILLPEAAPPVATTLMGRTARKRTSARTCTVTSATATLTQATSNPMMEGNFTYML